MFKQELNAKAGDLRGQTLKFEYGDLYRFLVSAGITLIALAVLGPWLFFREPIYEIINIDELKLLETKASSQGIATKKLQSNAVDIFLAKQTATLRAFKILPWFSLALLIAGITLAGLGCWFWLKRQRQDDQIASNDVERSNRELADMTSVEIKDKRMQDLNAALSSGAPEIDKLSFINSSEAVEDLIANRLSRILSNSHNVLRDQRIGDKYIDLLLSSKNQADTGNLVKEYIFEIKLSPKDKPYRMVLQSLNQLADLRKLYTSKTNSIPVTRLICVSGKETTERVQKDVEFQQDLKLHQPGTKHRTVFVTEQELNQANDNEFLQLLRI